MNSFLGSLFVFLYRHSIVMIVLNLLLCLLIFVVFFLNNTEYVNDLKTVQSKAYLVQTSSKDDSDYITKIKLDADPERTFLLFQHVDLWRAMDYRKFIESNLNGKLLIRYSKNDEVVELENGNLIITSRANSIFNKAYGRFIIVTRVFVILNLLLFLVCLLWRFFDATFEDGKTVAPSPFIKRLILTVVGTIMIIVILFYPAILRYFETQIIGNQSYRFFIYYHNLFYLLVLSGGIFFLRNGKECRE